MDLEVAQDVWKLISKAFKIVDYVCKFVNASDILINAKRLQAAN